jgi:hypothetical protein
LATRLGSWSTKDTRLRKNTFFRDSQLFVFQEIIGSIAFSGQFCLCDLPELRKLRKAEFQKQHFNLETEAKNSKLPKVPPEHTNGNFLGKRSSFEFPVIIPCSFNLWSRFIVRSQKCGIGLSSPDTVLDSSENCISFRPSVICSIFPQNATRTSI